MYLSVFSYGWMFDLFRFWWLGRVLLLMFLVPYTSGWECCLLEWMLPSGFTMGWYQRVLPLAACRGSGCSTSSPKLSAVSLLFFFCFSFCHSGNRVRVCGFNLNVWWLMIWCTFSYLTIENHLVWPACCLRLSYWFAGILYMFRMRVRCEICVLQYLLHYGFCFYSNNVFEFCFLNRIS